VAVVTASHRSNCFNKKNNFLPCVIVSCVLLCLPPLCFPQTVSKLPDTLQRCDHLYSQRADSVKTREAATCYAEAFAKNPIEDIAVRLSKTYYWLGAHSATDKQPELFQKGIDWSEKAIKINPKSAGGYFWLGVNNGKYGETRGILKSLFLVGPIKESMQQVIAIDPGYEYGGAYRVLGRMYFKLPRFAGGGIDKSIEYLKKSLQYAPNISTTRIFLAESYMAQKDYQHAQQELNSILSTPPIPGLEPEFTADKEEAKRLLAEVNKKIKD
jgi:tetratricopeptide (TPR) repeat protein